MGLIVLTVRRATYPLNLVHCRNKGHSLLCYRERNQVARCPAGAEILCEACIIATLFNISSDNVNEGRAKNTQYKGQTSELS